MLKPKIRDIQVGYDRVADEYVRRIYDELQHKPLDRKLLDRFVATIPPSGMACDIGTGPGHIARYLHDRGVNVCGIDLSAAMVDRASRLNRGIRFQQGNMFALKVPTETFYGITGFYALVNIPRLEVVRALRELRRVLKPGGTLLLAFHIGDHELRRDEWWGAEVSLYFYFFRSGEMKSYLNAADFEIEEIIERDPYPGIEQQNRRAYIFARKPKIETLPTAKQ
jgi:ubiquinone/menaquinone biosynthesis C-methylase UbiE